MFKQIILWFFFIHFAWFLSFFINFFFLIGMKKKHWLKILMIGWGLKLIVTWFFFAIDYTNYNFFFRIKFNVETKNIFILCIICHIKTLVHVYFCYFSNQVVPTRVPPDACWTRNKLSAMMLKSQFLTSLFWNSKFFWPKLTRVLRKELAHDY